MIVSADADAGETLARHLRGAGWASVSVASPVDAVVTVAQARPGLVLIDSRLPDAPIDQLADLLREHVDAPHVVVLANPVGLPDLAGLLPDGLMEPA